MFIVAIGWLYVVLMMSITETTPVAGVMTFILYGLVPVSLLLYISGGRQRKRRRAAEQQERQRQAAAAAQAEAEQQQPPP
jgi:biotin transporter BioY